MKASTPESRPGVRALVLLAILLACHGLQGQGAAVAANPQAVLTSAAQAHSLSIKEASRHYPVHLHAVVTYFDRFTDTRQTALFIHDATGSIYVAVPPGSVPPLQPGTTIDLWGVTAMGNFAPILEKPHILVTGRSGLPAVAPRVTLPELLTGGEDGQYVEVEGIIHAVDENEHTATLHLAMRDGPISVTTIREPGANYEALVDATVELRANAAPLFNGNGQLIGGRLVLPGLSAVRVVKPAPQNLFEQPAIAIDSLSRYDPRATAAHRVHLRGRVTLQWLGARLCIRDGTHGMCAQTDERTAMPLGAMVDILGFVATGEASPTLTDAVFRLAGPAEPTTAERITADPASLLQHDAGLVEVDGQLIGRDPAAADTTLMLASGKLIVAVLLPRGAANHEIDALRNGSRLRVTGICSVEMDADRSARTGGFPVAKSFRILLRSPQDVILVVAPSWWTPTHGLIVVASILAGMICVLLWNLGLRRRVEQQTHLISQSEKRFKHMAQHDALTGLPTRSVLHERLGEALAHSRESKITLGLLMLDIDNFKLINDLLGHDAGDETLRIAAKRLSRAVRETDTVARMGGDEFVVLFPDLGSEFQVEAIASKIVEAMSQPIRIGDRDVPVSASVGICTACDTSDDVDAMLKSADTALYHAKAQGRNCFQTFTSDMAKDTIAKLQLQAGLARAIEQNELRLHYQPLYSFATGRVEGFEALLRWQSRELGLVMPSTFIPIAEASGSIVPIGEWVLREACRELGALERQLGRTFLLSVNLSPRQCHAPGLPQTIASALADHQRLPGSVEFEITEGMMMTDSARTQSALAELRDSGLQLAIDDFGTGFSSLSYITRFSIDRIKIDKSFIQNCTTDKNSVAVVRAILAMAHGLSIQVVAEGVETAEQFRLLECEGCDTAQGYHLSRPIPASAIPALLESLEKPQAKARERITRKVAAGSRVVRTQAAGSGEKQSAPVDASLCGQAESRSARLPREERHPISSPLA